MDILSEVGYRFCMFIGVITEPIRVEGCQDGCGKGIQRDDTIGWRVFSFL